MCLGTMHWVWGITVMGAFFTLVWRVPICTCGCHSVYNLQHARESLTRLPGGKMQVECNAFRGMLCPDVVLPDYTRYTVISRGFIETVTAKTACYLKFGCWSN